ncbi:DUF3237 family protein [Aureibacter tunicatorum]|uniref:Uncharacterized protein n=1 Tax=Aureibacter tunicatorum TaxID=866807 RepID=A0AAE4BTZ5_9BACT|nr:DUF3237 family protein [Aureibacter tunicatorum]MDR6240460.1 hypothetical protein [Aureibacter tunicatorum]BDD05661.1 hypothetical protein AUTU_31440 [Aureibacter tunicatorum]
MKISILRFSFLFALIIGIASCDDDNDNQMTPQNPVEKETPNETDDSDDSNEESSIFDNLDENPDARLLYETVATATPIELYNAPETGPLPGARIDFTFFGDIEGELNGSFIGYDYATLPSSPEEYTDIDVFGTITTDDNASIAFRYKGEGVPVNETSSDLIETGYLSSNHPNYAYLNDLFIIPVGNIDLSTNSISVKYYAFENDPFNGENPYPEEETADFNNFPFTWDNIQENENATLVYEATIATTNMDGFGISQEDLFNGTAPIPAEGARVDFEFEGTTEGEINGDISGIDYATVLPDGSLELNVRGKIQTPEGAVISLKVVGVSRPGETQGISHLFETAELRTSHESYSYLNDKTIIGVGTSDITTNTLTVRLYRFDENPLN